MRYVSRRTSYLQMKIRKLKDKYVIESDNKKLSIEVYMTDESAKRIKNILKEDEIPKK